MAMADIDANDLTCSLKLVVRVRGMRRLAARWWLAAQLLRLAAFVSGMHMDVSTIETNVHDAMPSA